MSHKLGRLVVPYAMLALIASSMAIADRSLVYAAALLVQCVFYLLAGYGAWLEGRGRIAASRDARRVCRDVAGRRFERSARSPECVNFNRLVTR